MQAGDIGLMGGPAKKMNAEGKMKAVPGVKVFVGGTIGEHGKLQLDPTDMNGGADSDGDCPLGPIRRRGELELGSH